MGIAGHKTAPLGEALWVQKAVDTATDTPFFPALAIPPPCDGSDLQTVDLPRADYPADTLFDMEGSAFSKLHSALTGRTLAQCKGCVR